MLVIDVIHRKTSFNGQEVEISKLMYDVLVYLASNNNSAKSRDKILEACWPADMVTKRSVDVVIRKIRKRFGDEIIKTIKGVGYGVYDNKVNVVGLSGKYKVSKSDSNKIVEIDTLYINGQNEVVISYAISNYGEDEVVILKTVSTSNLDNSDSNILIVEINEFLSSYTKIILTDKELQPA